MRPRRLRRLKTILATAFVLLAATMASAERIASRGEDGASPRPAELARVQSALAHPEVAKALAAQGLSAADVEKRLDRLSDRDLERLAANVEQIQAAGNVPNYIWILLAALIVVTILATIF